ncbi:MAG: hypothetical protein Q6L60_15250 [Thermostichus sp. HHBFW_bins_43]
MASPASEPIFSFSPSSGEEHNSEFRGLADQVEQFGHRYRGQISQLSPTELAVALAELARLTQGLQGILTAMAPADRPGSWERLEQAITLQNQLLFFPLELQALPIDRLTDHCAEPELLRFRLHLSRLLRQRDHRQPEPLERLLNQHHLTGRLAWRQLWQFALRVSERHHLTNTDQASADTMGQGRADANAQLQRLQTHPSAEIRLAAYQRRCQHLEAHADLCGFILSTLVRDQLWEAQWRGYDSAAERYLARYGLTQTAFENLMEGIWDRFDLFQRYYRLKSREMGRSIRICDLHAPWEDPAPPLTAAAAAALIWATLQDFCPECATQAKPWLADMGNEEAEQEPEELAVGRPLLKVLNAVSCGLRPEDPLVWPDLEDLLGDPQPSALVQFHSAFLQLLVLDHLLPSGSPRWRERLSHQQLALAQAVLIHYLEAQLQAVFCQSLISRLEGILYRPGIPELENGETYPFWVSEEWLKLYQELCGDAVELLPEHQFDWVGIPELFLRPFSAHQASLSSLVALACYRRYQLSPRDFLPRYLNWLASPPGSLTLEESAQMLQVDLTDADGVLQALEELEHWIETLEELLEEGPNHR